MSVAFKDLFVLTNPPASQDDIAMLIDESPVRAPVALVSLLEQSDGADFEGDIVLHLKDGSTAGALSVLSASAMRAATRDLLTASQVALIWGHDGNGNYLTVDDDGRFGFWDHDWRRIDEQGVQLLELSSILEWRPEPPPVKYVVPPLGEIRLLDPVPRLRALTGLIEEERTADLERLLGEQVFTNEEIVKGVHRACSMGKVNALLVLIKHLPNIDARAREGHYTPLMAAASAGQLDCVKVLINAGASPLLTTSRGHNAYRIARVCKREQVVSFLSEYEGPS